MYEVKGELKELVNRCANFFGKDQIEGLLLVDNPSIKSYDVFVEAFKKKNDLGTSKATPSKVVVISDSSSDV